MSQTQEQMLQQINTKLDRLEKKCHDIDAAITGDDNRGVVGMRQHVKLIREKISMHEESDTARFNSIDLKMDENTNATKKIYWMVAGASVIISAVVVLANIFIKMI